VTDGEFCFGGNKTVSKPFQNFFETVSLQFLLVARAVLRPHLQLYNYHHKTSLLSSATAVEAVGERRSGEPALLSFAAA